MQSPVIMWFRQDLRLLDNPALHAAISSGSKIIPLYIWSEEDEGFWKLKEGSKWWLYHSLHALQDSLKELGSTLIIGKSGTIECLKKLLRETSASRIFCNHRYEPAAIALEQKLLKEKIPISFYHGNLLFKPTIGLKGDKTPYQIFTPFWKCLYKLNLERSLKKPTFLPPPLKNLTSLPIEDLKLISKKKVFSNFWTPGEKGAQEKLKSFLKKPIFSYAINRDYPAFSGTSQLSPHLHFGEISPRQIVEICKGLKKSTRDPFLRQICWREFAYRLLIFFPETVSHPFKKEFDDFPWKKSKILLEKWKMGMTGYPFIDAGMRQLLKTGWMHNRVRMAVASFLVKDLLIPWQEGAKWFWEKLIDADLANNTFGWQWSAGCGADSFPFFRVFNPEIQSEKFDPEGDYIRSYVPELHKMPSKWIHAPSKAPKEVLERAEVVLGKTYPKPLVNHTKSKEKALKTYQKWKTKK